jgi:hypothetical protein
MMGGEKLNSGKTVLVKCALIAPKNWRYNFDSHRKIVPILRSGHAYKVTVWGITSCLFWQKSVYGTKTKICCA